MMGSFPAAARLSAVIALTMAITGTSATAQARDDCRCVDRDGNEIENCSCFRTPRFEGLLSAYGLSGSRPRLGISVDVRQSARRDVAGALVTEVLDDGPADDAGIQQGDVITSIDGKSLFEPLAGDVEDDFDLDQSIPVQRLLEIAAELEAGQEVEVEYLRDDEPRTTVLEAEDLSDSWGRNFTVVAPGWDAERFRGQIRSLTEGARAMEFGSDALEGLAERLRDQEWRYSLEPRVRGEVRIFGGGDAPGLVIDRFNRRRDGLELVELNPSLGSYLGAEEGVLVAGVDEDLTLGLEAGDVVLRVGDRPVATPARMRRILQSYAEDEDVTFQIRRDGREMSVTGRQGG